MAFLLVIALLSLFVWIALRLWYRMIHADFVYRMGLGESLKMMLNGIPPITILKAKDLADAHQISLSIIQLQSAYRTGVDPVKVVELMMADSGLDFLAAQALAKQS